MANSNVMDAFRRAVRRKDEEVAFIEANRHLLGYAQWKEMLRLWREGEFRSIHDFNDYMETQADPHELLRSLPPEDKELVRTPGNL